jgi:hypothetical protein
MVLSIRVTSFGVSNSSDQGYCVATSLSVIVFSLAQWHGLCGCTLGMLCDVSSLHLLYALRIYGFFQGLILEARDSFLSPASMVLMLNCFDQSPSAGCHTTDLLTKQVSCPLSFAVRIPGMYNVCQFYCVLMM